MTMIRPSTLTRTALTLGCVAAMAATTGCSRRTTHAAPSADSPAPAAAPSASPLVPLPAPGAHLEDENNTMAVFDAAAPATVFVTQKQVVRDWSMRPLEVPAGTGSGFIWDRQGHIVTNFHVIDTNGAPGAYTVTLFNQKTYEATLVGGEPRKDIAVLKIDAPEAELTPIRLAAKGQQVRVGQKTIAIGNPFGLDHTLTTGVVSAIGREVGGYGGVSIRDMIQTDASINPGNSGGPLLDSAGQLIGMNTMIFSKSGASAGIGFAVPSSTIERVVPQLIKFGRVERAGLGVQLLPDSYAKRARIRGVIIASVAPGSPAEKAGFRGLTRSIMGGVTLGDVIIGIDDHEVSDYDDLYNALDRYKVGDTVRVKLQRGRDVIEVPVTLTEVG